MNIVLANWKVLSLYPLTEVIYLQFKLEEYMRRLKNGDKLNQDQLVCIFSSDIHDFMGSTIGNSW